MKIIASFLAFTLCLLTIGKHGSDAFKVVAFATNKNDVGHLSFVKESQNFFPALAERKNFTYTYTENWGNLNDDYLADVDVVLFLDTRPENSAQREAFERYAKGGGGFLGFHFAAFALDDSTYPQNWAWYHNEFLGCGQYVGNTWKPTPAVVQNEMPTHGAMGKVPEKFSTNANEWYKWEFNMRNNPDIDVLLSIHPDSFPLGTGPNPWEIWYEGDYPVVWSNNKYNMVYWNMGHNDIDYGNGNADLSHTFENANIEQLVTDCIYWMAYRKQAKIQQGAIASRFQQHLYGHH